MLRWPIALPKNNMENKELRFTVHQEKRLRVRLNQTHGKNAGTQAATGSEIVKILILVQSNISEPIHSPESFTWHVTVILPPIRTQTRHSYGEFYSFTPKETPGRSANPTKLAQPSPLPAPSLLTVHNPDPPTKKNSQPSSPQDSLSTFTLSQSLYCTIAVQSSLSFLFPTTFPLTSAHCRSSHFKHEQSRLPSDDDDRCSFRPPPVSKRRRLSRFCVAL